MHRRQANADTFQAIAHPARRRVLELLERDEHAVGELAAHFDASAPALSQHLKVLKDAGLVGERREGRQRIYFLTPEPLLEVSSWVAEHQAFWQTRLVALGRYLKKKHGDPMPPARAN